MDVLKGLRVDLSGQEELLKNMDNLSVELKNKVKEEAIIEAAEFVRDIAKEKAPVDTGFLRENIIVQVVENNNIVTEAKVGPNRSAFYGAIVEYGSKKMKKKPYLRPAYDENLDKINEIISRRIQEGIDKAVKNVDTN